MLKLAINLVLILVIVSLSFAQNTPIGYSQWQRNEIQKETIFGRLYNFQKPDSSWAEIENGFTDSAGVLFHARNAILRTEVTNNGRSIVTLNYKGNEYIVTQAPKRLIWLKTDTWDWVDVFSSTSWPTPTVNGNVITWNNIFPGINYQIIKENGSVPHRVLFKPAFLDSAVTLYNQRADSQTIALGNVIEYSLTGVDNADIEIGNVPKRVLKKLKDFVFEISQQKLWHDAVQTSDTITQRWVKQSGKLYCIEYVMMSDVKQIHEDYPTDIIWHNSETETVVSRDTYGYEGAATTNYGTEVTFSMRHSGSAIKKWAYVYFNISAIPATDIVDSAILFFFKVQPNNNTDTWHVGRLTTEWVEDTASWDSARGDILWTTAGGDYDSCGNTENDEIRMCDSTTRFNSADYNDSTWCERSDSTDGELSNIVQKWIKGTYTNYGFEIKTTYDAGDMNIKSLQEEVVARRPYLRIIHSEGPTGKGTIMRTVIQ
ncbi:DNRLRE domain-containing protein [Candidatus Pacearchaeota archaeon]|nr:DNRLRE domain-containing protein [Candidatus Pacearchaeota archaeon]